MSTLIPDAADPSTTRWHLEGDVAVLTLDNPPVNGLSYGLRITLVEALKRAQSEPAVRAVVLVGAGDLFCGGADLRQLGGARYWQYPRTIELAAHLDTMSKPVVAAIGKLALGGGLELALGCHSRIAVEHASLALPEVRLGLIPGGGGTLRLARLVGYDRALTMMLTGDAVDGRTALRIGLVDAVCASEQLLQTALDRARALADGGKPPRRTVDLQTDTDGLAERLALETARARASADGGGAALAILAGVQEALTGSMARAFELAGEHTAQRIASPESKALRHLFFAERAAARPPSGTEAARLARIALAGAIQPELLHALQRAGVDCVALDASPSNDVERPAVDLAIVGLACSPQADHERLAALARSLPEPVPWALLAPSGEFGRFRAAHPRRRLMGLRTPISADSRVLEVVPLDASAEAAALARALRRSGWIPIIVGDAERSVTERLFTQAASALRTLLRSGHAPTALAQALYAWGLRIGPLQHHLHRALGLKDWAPDNAVPSDPDAPAEAVSALLAALRTEIGALHQSALIGRTSDADVILARGAGFPPFRSIGETR